MPQTKTDHPVPRIPPALTILVVGAVLYFAKEVLVPIALAVLLAFLLAPLVRRLERHRVPRILAVGVAVGVTALGVGAVGWLLQGQLLQFAANLPVYKDNIREKLHALRPVGGGVLDQAGDTLKELERDMAKPDAAKTPVAKPDDPLPVRVVETPTPPLSYARSLLGSVLSRIATAGIVVVFAIFMLLKREDLRDRMLWLIGERAMPVSTPALDDAANRVSRYLMMQSGANAVTGLAAGIGLYAIGLPGAAVWGLLIGVFRFIPYVGAFIGAALPFALSVAVAPGWMQPLLVIAVVVGVEVVVANGVEPFLFGAGTGLSPLAILAATVFWAWLWGPVGLLLATPLTVCLAVIGRNVPDLAFLEVLLGDEPVLSPSASLYQRLLAGDQDEAGRIIEGFSKEREPAEVYDALLIPALRLAESDRVRGALSPQGEHAIQDMLSLILEDTAPAMAASGPDAREVLCVPARNHADELACRMLAGLLGTPALAAASLSADMLTGEVVERIAKAGEAVVCISTISPHGLLHCRVLSKRLRARFPDLPIFVGLWDPTADAERARQRLGVGGLAYVSTTLRQAVDQIRTFAGTVLAAGATTPVASENEEGSGALSVR